MLKRHAIYSASLIAVLVVFASCVHEAPMTKVGRWTEYCVRMANMVKASEDAVISLNKTGVIGTEDTAKAMKGYQRIGGLIQRLSDSLNLYAYSPSEATAKIISDLITTINNILLDILGAIGDQKAHEQVAQLFVEVSKLAVTITGEVQKYGGR